MNSTKNVMNLSNYIAGASNNDHSFDFTSNKGPMSGKFRGSYNMGAGTRNNRLLLNRNASNASPKYSIGGYETEGNQRKGPILFMGEDTGYGTDDFGDITVNEGLIKHVSASAASTKNFGHNRLGPRTPTSGGNVNRRMHMKKQFRNIRNTRNLSAVPGNR